MKIFIPNKNQESEEGKENKDENEEKNDENNKVQTTAEKIKDEISKYVNDGSLGGAIAVLSEVQMMTPRGKFDIHFQKNALKIHGQSNDFKISFKNIQRSFILPKPDGVHLAIVLALSTPIRQGNTSYPFLVFQFKNKTQKTIELNIPEDENERKAIFKNPIEPSITGEMFDIMAKLVRSLIGIGIIMPGSFKSSKNLSCVKCNFKASDGLLYPLERCLLFIQKPVVYISLEDIKQVDCARTSEAQRSFDIKIITRKEEIAFNGIERDEYDSIIKYFGNKKVKLVNSEQGNDIDVSTTVKLIITLII